MQLTWFWLTSIVLALYALADGFDFGAGILHLFVARTDSERRVVFSAVGPWWDGNEVWLLAGGGVLFLAFPKVLAAGLSGFYLAIFLVVWTLLLRGIAIEFRSHLAEGLWRSFFDGVFALASLLMPILLGAALGNVIRGVPLDATGFFNLPLFTHGGVGGPQGILDWYTVLTGVFVLAALTLHGALYLAWKAPGKVAERSAKAVLPLWAAVVLLTLVATLATGKVNPDLFPHFRKAPAAWASLVLFLGGLAAVPVLRRRPLGAFLGSCAFIVGILAATAASLWPVMLRSTLNPAWTLDALGASAGAYGMRAGLCWWFVAFLLALTYFTTLLRIHRGRVQEGDGYGGR